MHKKIFVPAKRHIIHCSRYRAALSILVDGALLGEWAALYVDDKESPEFATRLMAADGSKEWYPQRTMWQFRFMYDTPEEAKHLIRQYYLHHGVPYEALNWAEQIDQWS